MFLKTEHPIAKTINNILIALSEKYRKQMFSCLTLFLRFVDGDDILDSFNKVNIKMIFDYQESLKKISGNGKILNASTINDYFGMLKNVWKKLKENGNIAVSPFEYWKPLKYSKSNLKKVIPERIIHNIINELLQKNDMVFSQYRNKVMFVLLVLTGIRISEAIYIKWSDISDNNGVAMLTVVGKGNKEIVRPLPITLYRIIADYRAAYNDCEYLFYRYYAGCYQQLSPRAIQFWFKSNIGYEYSPHCTRHTAISKYYGYEKDIIKTANFAGHSNIHTTRTYVHEKERLEDVIPERMMKEYVEGR